MTETISPTLPSVTELGEIVQEVWSSFLGGELVILPGGTVLTERAGALVATVSISGEWAGHLMIVAGPDCARAAAAAMFMMEPDEVAVSEIADALGEIANMVGGSVKGMVGVPAVLSLPQVVLDASALVSPDARKLVSVDGQWKDMPLEISLWERTSDGHPTNSGKES